MYFASVGVPQKSCENGAARVDAPCNRHHRATRHLQVEPGSVPRAVPHPSKMGVGGWHLPFNSIPDVTRKSPAGCLLCRLSAYEDGDQQFGVPNVRRYLRKRQKQSKTAAEKSK